MMDIISLLPLAPLILGAAVIGVLVLGWWFTGAGRESTDDRIADLEYRVDQLENSVRDLDSPPKNHLYWDDDPYP